MTLSSSTTSTPFETLVFVHGWFFTKTTPFLFAPKKAKVKLKDSKHFFHSLALGIIFNITFSLRKA